MAERAPTRNKTVPTGASVAEFLASVNAPARREDCRKVMELMQEATGEPPVMWGPSIIGFGAYHYRYATGREGDMPLVGVSPRKRELTLYIMPGFADYGAMLQRLGKHRTGKSCLYINKLADVHLPTLRQLVRASVQAIRQKYGVAQP